MDEQGCPRCKTTKYRNPSLKMMVNACGHSLCESCVDMLFIKGSGVCPECGTALRRNNYRLQLFEDAGVEKEMDIRKKVMRDFNKKEEDFSSLREYNDYLEMIETITGGNDTFGQLHLSASSCSEIAFTSTPVRPCVPRMPQLAQEATVPTVSISVFNLVDGVDVDATRRMIEQYKKENKDFIKKNQSKLSRDDEYLEELISQQRMQTVTRKQQETEEQEREKALKRKHKNALIDDLMFSDKAAKDIVATHKQTTSPMEDQPRPTSSATSIFSSGIRMGQQSVFEGRKLEENTAYQYFPLVLYPCGPSYPDMEAILCKGYLHNVRSAMEWELGGGFEPQVACQRALQDALCGLFHCPPAPQACSPSPSSSSSQSVEDDYSPMCVS